ncbi:hypothetical protein GARC_0561 [Paraglaciecola arctica BSs20135]|uniref:Uncharacterized protein n=1 Tax=Paraglaciecola arctica BSs20135 TaxID=493475 RepID=K6YH89_9ALTE|nr:hypothetical protein GARC_0561 [Paraglaciecola arctica BSs20135]
MAVYSYPFVKSQKAEFIHHMLIATLAKHVVQKYLRII